MLVKSENTLAKGYIRGKHYKTSIFSYKYKGKSVENQ